MQKRSRAGLLTAWLVLVAACSAHPAGNNNTAAKDIDPFDTPVLADTFPDSAETDSTVEDKGPDLGWLEVDVVSLLEEQEV